MILPFGEKSPSSIQTLLSVLESHQIIRQKKTLADYTAGRELHPALKTYCYFKI